MTPFTNILATGYGMLCNSREPERLLDKTFTLYSNFAFRRSFGDHGTRFIGLEIGPHLTMPTQRGPEGDLFLHYGLSGGLGPEHLVVMTEFSGRLIVTEDLKIGRRTNHYLAIGVALTDFAVRPHVFYQIPLDDPYENCVSGVVGIKLEVTPK